MRSFCNAARLEGRFFLCQQESLFLLARHLDGVEGLSLQDRYNFCMAPVNIRDPNAVGEILDHARRYAAGQRVPLDMDLPSTAPTNHHELRIFENAHQLVSQWLWLSNRFSAKQFVGRKKVEKLEGAIVERMKSALEGMTARVLYASSEDEYEEVWPSRRMSKKERRLAKKRARRRWWQDSESEDEQFA